MISNVVTLVDWQWRACDLKSATGHDATACHLASIGTASPAGLAEFYRLKARWYREPTVEGRERIQKLIAENQKVRKEMRRHG